MAAMRSSSPAPSAFIGAHRRMRTLFRDPLALLFFLAAVAAEADITGCACDPADPVSMEARLCSLSREAAKQPPEPGFFFLKDISPRKQKRTLMLPRRLEKGVYRLSDLTPKERLEFWTEAIRKAEELWGDDWGLAVNGDKVRTQCHPHIHIGKFLKASEKNNFIVINHPRQIPVPKGDGLWIHPVDKRLHVHTGEQICETVLLR